MMGIGKKWEVIEGDCLTRLREMAPGSANLCFTSPPYWSLRSYLAADDPLRPLELGQERTPEGYVGALVAVLREVWRVLRDDGCCFVNIGDSYIGSMKGMGADGKAYGGPKQQTNRGSIGTGRPDWSGVDIPHNSLALIPARLALALQADGWIVRNDVIWAKGISFCPAYAGSVMPSSDPTKMTPAHEHVFFLTKQQRYWSDFYAVRESAVDPDRRGADPIGGARPDGVQHSPGGTTGRGASRNLRDVWALSPEGSDLPHYAMFPKKLVRPAVRACCPERCCVECGAPWQRVVAKTPMVIKRSGRSEASGNRTDASGTMVAPAKYETLGFAPTCACGPEAGTRPGVVLDPFSGMATTGVVSIEEGRRYIGIELNPEYAERSRRRLASTTPTMFAETIETAPDGQAQPALLMD